MLIVSDIDGTLLPYGATELDAGLFPLIARFDAQGNPVMRIDPRARAVCPLCSSGVSGLSRDFVAAAQQACDSLMQDPACAAFLRALSDQFCL